MGVLTNLETLKQHLDMEDETEFDTVLNTIIDEVDEVVANEIPRGRVPGNHPISSVAGTEYYDGSGREQLILRRRPVTAIARVAVDGSAYYGRATGAFPVSSDWTDGDDFVSMSLDESESNPGILISLRNQAFSGTVRKSGLSSEDGIWPKGRGNVLVTYTAGYTTIPNDLSLAAILLASRTFTATKMRLGGPVNNVRLGNTSYQLLNSNDDDMGTVRRILSKYKEVV